MATERTPTYKRINRAESSAADWKKKATERREENERLKERLAGLEKKSAQSQGQLAEADARVSAIEKKVELLLKELEVANQTTVKQQEEIAELKKKIHCKMPLNRSSIVLVAP